MEDIKEGKKVLTDYMLELNADIQRAEDWANTGADEEMYFALKTVLDRLEQLEKENAIYVRDNNYLMKNSIPKSVIRKEIEKLEEMLPNQYVHIDYTKKMLKELLGGSNE